MSKLAIFSFIVSIIPFVSLSGRGISRDISIGFILVFVLIGLVTSIISLLSIKKNGLMGKWFAIASLVLSIIFIALIIIVVNSVRGIYGFM